MRPSSFMNSALARRTVPGSGTTDLVAIDYCSSPELHYCTSAAPPIPDSLVLAIRQLLLYGG